MQKNSTAQVNVTVPASIARGLKISAIRQERPLKEVCAEAFAAYLASTSRRTQPT